MRKCIKYNAYPSMNNTKEAINHTEIGDQINPENPTCFLEELDRKCGHVYFHENSRLLKFHCIYCGATYEDVEYFCQHLSEHITDTDELDDKDDVQYKEEQDIDEYKCDIEDEQKDIYETSESIELNEKNTFSIEKESLDEEFKMEDAPPDDFEYDTEIALNNDVSTNAFDNLHVEKFDDENEMIVEEIDDDADEIRTEVEEEMMQNSLESTDASLLLNDNSCSGDLGDYDKETSKPKATFATNVAKNVNSFEDCFIKETNIDKIRSEGVCVLKEKRTNRKPTLRRKLSFQEVLRLKRRHKKVTTVKVIAVKNRIAELYERIENEKEKSHQIFSNNLMQDGELHEQETQDAIESLINDDIEDNNSIEESKSSSKEITRKIIGETLITLIPEGTQIPNKLPSPIAENMSINSVAMENKNNNATNSYTSYHKENITAHDKKAVCPACGKTFRSHFSLTIHKRIHYLESDSAVKLAHKCSDCDQLFNKLSQLKVHVENVHYPEGFICKICNRKLSSISLLERHMVKVHLDRPFNCKHCNKNFSDPITFEEHLVSHTSGEVFKCLTCGRKYATEYFLQEHMRNHKEQVPQTCVVCGKVTLRITQHMKIHTPRPKRLLSCSVCGKVFNFSSGLSHHFKIMHKLPRPPPKPKKEPNLSVIKRRRRPRNIERTQGKKKQDHNSSSDSPYVITPDKYSNQIIEEQIEEIPHEVYESTPHTIIHLESTENLEDHHNVHTDLEESDNNHHINELLHQEYEEDVNHKEEEAKRVIVELIQNATYTSFFPDNLSSVLEVTPPIAREETISAVNSIVHDC